MTSNAKTYRIPAFTEQLASKLKSRAWSDFPEKWKPENKLNVLLKILETWQETQEPAAIESQLLGDGGSLPVDRVESLNKNIQKLWIDRDWQIDKQTPAHVFGLLFWG